MAPVIRLLGVDPRWPQIAVLSALLVAGLSTHSVDVSPEQLGWTFAGALAAQALGTRWAGLPRFDPRSALISALSLCLLLRVGTPALAGLGAAVAVGSKFLIRARGKHIMNPTNFGLAALMLGTDAAWVSAGQWGSAAVFAGALACAGLVVVRRAERSDVTLAFIAAHVALIFGRALWLGDPLAIPVHQLESGALVLFAFFMISDPKTTPDARHGRVIYAICVAGVAYFIRFVLYEPNDLIWALALCSPLVPLVDALIPAARHRWPTLSPRPLEASP